jgi:GNAT superfamily N-acetyltransferase
MKDLKRLNDLSSEFNVLNEDFFERYDRAGIAGKLLERRRVRLLKCGSDCTGFIWFERYTKSTCRIRSMFSDEKDSLSAYRLLVESIGDFRNIQYSCTDNVFNFRMLEDLGFERGPGEIEMLIGRDEIMKALEEKPSSQPGLVFKTFEKGKDEGLRCWVQNDIFENSSRVPLSLSDIIHDVSQRYFLEGGAAFLYVGGDCIGYGQIVIHGDIPYLVNIGIIKGYRGRGYGRVLVKHFLKTILERGFDEVRLNVKSDNLAAFNLYKSLGFSVDSETCRWQKKDKR